MHRFDPTWPQHRLHLGSTSTNKAPTSAQVGPTWPQLRPNLAPRWRNLAPSWTHLGYGFKMGDIAGPIRNPLIPVFVAISPHVRWGLLDFMSACPPPSFPSSFFRSSPDLNCKLYCQCRNYRTEVEEYEGTVIYRTLLFYNSVFLGRYEKKCIYIYIYIWIYS